MSSSTTLALIESILNDSDSKFSSIKSFYSNFDEYQVQLCNLADSIDQLDRVSALISNDLFKKRREYEYL